MATTFLATVIGWYLVIFSLFILFENKYLRLVMTEVIEQRGLFFVLALITLILGLLMVTSHNLWVMGWPVIVTLLSWLVLISALIRLLFPDKARKMGKSFFNHPVRTKITSVVLLIIGVFLLFKIYYPF